MPTFRLDRKAYRPYSSHFIRDLTNWHRNVTVQRAGCRRHPSPARRVTVATLPGAGVAPAARSMIQVLTDVARRYSDRTGDD